MDEIRDISDLRPAPLPTPPAALWVMGVVAVGGIWLLATSNLGTTDSRASTVATASGASSSPVIAGTKRDVAVIMAP